MRLLLLSALLLASSSATDAARPPPTICSSPDPVVRLVQRLTQSPVYITQETIDLSVLPGMVSLFWIDGGKQVEVLEACGDYLRLRDLLGRTGWAYQPDLHLQGFGDRVRLLQPKG